MVQTRKRASAAASAKAANPENASTEQTPARQEDTQDLSQTGTGSGDGISTDQLSVPSQNVAEVRANSSGETFDTDSGNLASFSLPPLASSTSAAADVELASGGNLLTTGANLVKMESSALQEDCSWDASASENVTQSLAETQAQIQNSLTASSDANASAVINLTFVPPSTVGASLGGKKGDSGSVPESRSKTSQHLQQQSAKEKSLPGIPPTQQFRVLQQFVSQGVGSSGLIPGGKYVIVQTSPRIQAQNSPGGSSDPSSSSSGLRSFKLVFSDQNPATTISASLTSSTASPLANIGNIRESSSASSPLINAADVDNAERHSSMASSLSNADHSRETAASASNVLSSATVSGQQNQADPYPGLERVTVLESHSASSDSSSTSAIASILNREKDSAIAEGRSGQVAHGPPGQTSLLTNITSQSLDQSQSTAQSSEAQSSDPTSLTVPQAFILATQSPASFSQTLTSTSQVLVPLSQMVLSTSQTPTTVAQTHISTSKTPDNQNPVSVAETPNLITQAPNPLSQTPASTTQNFRIRQIPVLALQSPFSASETTPPPGQGSQPVRNILPKPVKVTEVPVDLMEVSVVEDDQDAAYVEVPTTGATQVVEEEGEPYQTQMVWTNEATLKLIQLYKEHKVYLNDHLFKKKSVWEVIANRLRKEVKDGIHYRWNQVENKWKNMTKKYRDCIDNNKRYGTFIKCRFYDELAEVYDYNPDEKDRAQKTAAECLSALSSSATLLSPQKIETGESSPGISFTQTLTHNASNTSATSTPALLPKLKRQSTEEDHHTNGSTDSTIIRLLEKKKKYAHVDATTAAPSANLPKVSSNSLSSASSVNDKSVSSGGVLGSETCDDVLVALRQLREDRQQQEKARMERLEAMHTEKMQIFREFLDLLKQSKQS